MAALQDVTECAICTKTYCDPRVLPCIHTYCLTCIEQYGKGKRPGDKIACPLCGEEFTISDTGLAGLPKSSFMNRLLDAKKFSDLSARKGIPCDVCNSDEKGNHAGQEATFYCMECEQKYCSMCSMYHQKMKGTSDHKQVEIGNEQLVGDLMKKLPASSCDQHPSEELKLYCMTCTTPVCTMCYITLHLSHKYCNIQEVCEDLRTQIGQDADKAGNGIESCEQILKKLTKNKTEVTAAVCTTVEQICEVAERQKIIIDHHKQILIEKLGASKDKLLSQMRDVEKEVEVHIAALRSFRSYSEQLRDKGTAVDVASSANSLHDRAEKIVAFDFLSYVNKSPKPLKITFKPSTYSQPADDTRNVVGSIVLEESSLSSEPQPLLLFATVTEGAAGSASASVLHDTVDKSRLVYHRDQLLSLHDSPLAKNLHSLLDVPVVAGNTLKNSPTPSPPVPRSKPASPKVPKSLRNYITGVTMLGNKVFTLYCSSHLVKIFSASTLKQIGELTLPSSGSQLYGLASCATNQCLYVSDYSNHVVHRISLTAGNEATHWPVARYPTGLSLNSAVNLIVVSHGEAKIQEYSTHGTLISEVSLVPEAMAWFALQLPSGSFLVSQGNKICLIGMYGNVEQRYGYVNSPVGIVVDKHGSVIVADQCNNCILVLDKSLSHASTLALPVDGDGLNNPWALCLDESRGRLYVGEFDGGRLLVFERMAKEHSGFYCKAVIT